MTSTTTLTRRNVLKSMGATGALVTIGASGMVFTAPPAAAANGATGTSPGSATDSVIVTVFLRGAADGLNIVIPHGDNDYATLRPTIKIAEADSQPLGGIFGLNNHATGLIELYEAGDLAFVHAAGSHETTRSHFSAMDNMDLALGGAASGGWLRRSLDSINAAAPTASYGMGMFPNPSLRGAAGAAPVVPSISAVQASRNLGSAGRRDRLVRLHRPDPWFAETTLRGLASTDALLGMPGVTASPAYDFAGELHDTGAGRLSDVARLINADIGVRAVTVDTSHWDHHNNEDRDLPVSLSQLGRALSAFWQDLQTGPTNAAARTVVIVMSEFGRTAAQNGAKGTEHGHGNVMMVLGANVEGGRVYLADDQWPGLNDLYEGQDLRITTDFRSVFAEVVGAQFGDGSVASAVPNFTPQPVGLFASTGAPALTQAVAGQFDYRPTLPAVHIGWTAVGAPSGAVGSRLEWRPIISRGLTVAWEGTDIPTLDRADFEIYKERPNVGIDPTRAYEVRVAWRLGGGGVGPWTTVIVGPW